MALGWGWLKGLSLHTASQAGRDSSKGRQAFNLAAAFPLKGSPRKQQGNLRFLKSRACPFHCVLLVTAMGHPT